MNDQYIDSGKEHVSSGEVSFHQMNKINWKKKEIITVSSQFELVKLISFKSTKMISSYSLDYHFRSSMILENKKIWTQFKSRLNVLKGNSGKLVPSFTKTK